MSSLLKSLVPADYNTPTPEELLQQNRESEGDYVPSFLKDTFPSLMDSALISNPSSKILSNVLEEDKVYKADQLNSMLNTTMFTEDMPLNQAMYLETKTRSAMRAQELMELAGYGSKAQTAIGMGAGIVGSMFDPALVALNIVGGSVFNHALRTSSKLTALSNKVTPFVAENIVQDAFTTAYDYGVSKATEKFTKETPDLMNDLIMSAGFNALSYGVIRLYNRGWKGAKVDDSNLDIPDNVRSKLENAGILNQRSGVTPTDASILDTYNKKISERVSRYTEREVDGGIYFAMNKDNNNKLRTNNITFGKEYGHGITGSDSKLHLKEASRVLGIDTELLRFHLEPSNMKILDLDSLDMSSPEANFIITGAKNYLGVDTSKYKTLNELFEAINKLPKEKAESALKYFASVDEYLSQNGFDAMAYNNIDDTRSYKLTSRMESELEKNYRQYPKENIYGLQETLDSFAITPYIHEGKVISGEINLNRNRALGEVDTKSWEIAGLLDDYQGARDIMEEMGILGEPNAMIDWLGKHAPMLVTPYSRARFGEGHIHNGKKIRINLVGDIEIDPINAKDADFMSNYREMFSIEQQERIKNLVFEDRDAKALKEFPDLTKQATDMIKEIEMARQYDALITAQEKAEDFFKYENWLYKPLEEIAENLRALGLKPKEYEKFINNQADIYSVREELVLLQEEFTDMLIQEDNKIWKETSRSILKESEMQRLQEKKDISAMYKYLKDYVAKDTEYTKGVQEKSLKQFEKLAKKSDRLDNIIKDKLKSSHKMLSDLNQKELKKNNYDNLTEQVKELVADLKKNNPDRIATLVKAAEVCIRRNP